VGFCSDLSYVLEQENLGFTRGLELCSNVPLFLHRERGREKVTR